MSAGIGLFLLHALQAPLCLFLPKLFQRVGILWKQIGSGRLCHGATLGFAKQRPRQREKERKNKVDQRKDIGKQTKKNVLVIGDGGQSPDNRGKKWEEEARGKKKNEREVTTSN